jgi:REP element-mobilizing transposase RayT
MSLPRVIMLPMTRRPRQISLSLPAVPRWGGRRDGAGRKPGLLRRDPHALRPPLASRHPCHVTLRVRRDVPSLRSVRLVREFERSLRGGCDRGRFRVVHYSLQSNHVHLNVEAASARDLACGMKSLGARLARAVNRVAGRRGRVLSDRYHLQVLRTPREVRNAIAYVLLNARKHAMQVRGVVSRALAVDPASSGRWFDGWREAIARPRDPPVVAQPRSWLLARGWRRWTLVSVQEVPGVKRRCRRR